MTSSLSLSPPWLLAIITITSILFIIFLNSQGEMNEVNLVASPLQFEAITTTTDPSFIIAITNEKSICRNLVSTSVKYFGYFAPIETLLFRSILHVGCKKKGKDGKSPLVVDVGGNIGYFTLYAAEMGCRVKTFEPIPQIIHYMNTSIQIGGYDKIEVFNIAAFSSKGETIISYNCDDTGLSYIDPTNENGFTVRTDTLDNYIEEDVLLLKIDTEGFEDHVLKGSESFLSNYRVENIICETKYFNDVNYKREFMNKMIKNGYDIESYRETYDTTINIKAGLDQEHSRFSKVSHLGSNDWIPFEDVIYRHKP